MGSQISLWGIWPRRYRGGKRTVQTLLSKRGRALGLTAVVIVEARDEGVHSPS